MVACLALAAFRLIHAQDDDLAKELPRIPAKSPQEALASFKLHKGFSLGAAAVEPLITDPVSLAYDADGRAYVVEMRGYPYPEKQPSGNVSLLTDKDGDGVFDTSTIFVNDLSWPTGVVPYDGGVFITVAPDIIYAKDTNGDGKADIKRVVFTGFGTQNVQGLLNGLLWGTDGWIYGSSGSNGGDIKNLTRAEAPVVSVRGRDFRFKPDCSAFEAISGGGQFGHSVDDWGHRFVCNNSNHMRQIVLPSRELERNPFYLAGSVIHDIAVEGGASPVFRISSAEPWRIVRTRQRAADPAMVKRLPPTELFAIGFFTSATGVTIYRGSAYPGEYQGNAFIGDVGGNLVHRKIVSKDGPIYKATRADEKVEFLASPDNWFRPVNFANTPYGTLMILDMYRETIEHPASIPEPIKKHLDLTSGKDRGRLYELINDGFKRRAQPKLSSATTAELVAALADRDGWWRDTAQRLLIERKDSAAVPLLIELAGKRPSALARAHALWTLDVFGKLPAEQLIQALKDDDANVREAAVRLAAGRQDVAAEVYGLAKDADAMVRFQAAFTLGSFADSQAVDALAEIAARSGGNHWTRAAVLSSVKGRAEQVLASLLKRLDKSSDTKVAETSAWVSELAYLIGAENQPGKVVEVLTDLLPPQTADPRLARAALVGIGNGLKRSGKTLAQVVPDRAILTRYFDAARTAAQGRGSVASRIDAIQILGLAPADAAVDVLAGLLDAREPSNVQLAALQTLGTFNDPKVGPKIVAQWKSLSPTVRREAVEVMLARADRVLLLLDAIGKKEIPANDLDPARQTTLRNDRRPAVRDKAKAVLAELAKSDRTQVILALKPALTLEGKRDHGRTVFKATCATCHKAEDMGVEVGPNLATVTNRSPEDLLVHILDPNREVPANYVNYSVATTDGRVVTGLIASETGNAIVLKRAEGATDTVIRDQIEQIAASGQSLMPEGLEKGLNAQDFADLIAFLKSLQPKQP